MKYDYLLEIAAALFIIGMAILIGIPLFHRLGKKEPEVTRKWTDPSMRD
ncbi:MAG: hypothetical protein U0136_01865 [Bdellovibrionota bacterium]